MKTALWVPCDNEGTHLNTLITEQWGPMPEDGHILYRTLELLREKIRSGIFDHIIITNDGSTDDTIEGLIRFIRENDIPRDKFRILGDQSRENNQGKTMRFFEAVNFAAKRLETELLVMTDADMVNAGGDTFNQLARPNTTPMQISFQGEWCEGKYSFSGRRTSGTRSVHIATLQESFEKKGIQPAYFEEGCGYGLESLLNHSLDYRMIQILHNTGNTPLFLRHLRRKAHLQGVEIRKTESILDEMGLKEK